MAKSDKKQGIKIATIGGGSSYTPELVEGFIKRYEQLPVRELWLVDIDEGKEKLEIVGEMAKRMVKKAGIPMEIHLTLDRRAALKDADYVTTQLRVGLLDARIKDERIPISHGMIGQETNGFGGLFKGLRTIPVILDIVKDMKELCPNAWLVNFANPSGMITEAVLRYTDHKKVVGLCNVPIGMQSMIAQLLEVEEEAIQMEIVGLNHHFFVTNVLLNGISVFDEVLEKYIASLGAETEVVQNIFSIKWSNEFLRGIHAIPCPYHNYYFNTLEQMEHQQEEFKKGEIRAELVKKVEAELFELYKDPNLDHKPEQLSRRGGARYSDAACNLITSIHNNTRDIQYVNCRSNGALLDFDANSGAEIAAVITSDGPKPIAVGEIPYALRGYIQMIKSFERLVCEAAVSGDRNIAIAAANMNPLIPSDKQAVIVFDELLEAHKKYLPNFFK